MAINRVDYGNETLIDLSADTITADDLVVGVTAHDRTGNIIVGNLDIADYIVEFSRDYADWSYIKYQSGIQIAWYRSPTAVSTATTSQSGSLYYTTVSGIQAPCTWTAKPVTHFNIRAAGVPMGASITGESLSSGGVYSFNVFVWASTSGTRNVNYDIQIFGHWK